MPLKPNSEKVMGPLKLPNEIMRLFFRRFSNLRVRCPPQEVRIYFTETRSQKSELRGVSHKFPLKQNRSTSFLTGSFGGFFYVTHPILYVIEPLSASENFKVILRA